MRAPIFLVGTFSINTPFLTPKPDILRFDLLMLRAHRLQTSNTISTKIRYRALLLPPRGPLTSPSRLWKSHSLGINNHCLTSDNI